VSVDDADAEVAAFVAKNQLQLTVLRDPRGALSASLDVQQMPTAMVLDRTGRVIFAHAGFVANDEGKIEASVKAALATPPASVERTPIERSFFAMGTPITFVAYAADADRAAAAFEDAFREISRLEGLFTTWKEDSDVSRINAAAGKSAVHVAPDTIDILLRAKDACALTKGKFDVTFGVLSGLWRFDHDQDDRIPPKEEIAKRLPLIDCAKVRVDRASGTVLLEREGMRIHLGGIGKGYAVDRAVALLRKAGLLDFMIQAGGDLFASGRRGDRPWRVGIRDPRGPTSSAFAVAEIADATFSTSGDYERSFLKDGRRYHHIIDPATGEPATESRSVTIVAPDATTAEGLSKGVFILGVKEGFRIIDALDGVGAVVVDAHDQVHVSRRLEGRVQILFSPTDAL
jgi:thiamine biosynthesis lipoprotein